MHILPEAECAKCNSVSGIVKQKLQFVTKDEQRWEAMNCWPIAFDSLEIEFVDFVYRSCQYRLFATHHNRPLYKFRMFRH